MLTDQQVIQLKLAHKQIQLCKSHKINYKILSIAFIYNSKPPVIFIAIDIIEVNLNI